LPTSSKVVVKPEKFTCLQQFGFALQKPHEAGIF